jgi:predicted dehydrogenase
MATHPIPAAVIGLSSTGQAIAHALAADPQIELAGIADQDHRLARTIAEPLGVDHFGDNRQLLLNAQPEVLFLSIPPMQAGELLQECIDQSVHVWKDAPTGRGLAEAAAYVKWFDQAGLKLATAAPRRFARSYRQGKDWFDRLGPIAQARAEYCFCWGPQLGWRADRQSAGGGALLELGFGMIDQLVWMMGLPVEAYGITRLERPGCQENPNPHDTDDTASALLHYPQHGSALLSTSRLIGPVREELILRGCKASCEMTPTACLLRSPSGEIIEHHTDSETPAQHLARQARQFCQAVADDAPRWASSAAESLLSHAVIEAIDLSGQTNQPESPQRQLEIAGLKVATCLARRPDTIDPLDE